MIRERADEADSLLESVLYLEAQAGGNGSQEVTPFRQLGIDPRRGRRFWIRYRVPPFPCAVLGYDSVTGGLKGACHDKRGDDNSSDRHFVGEHLQGLILDVN